MVYIANALFVPRAFLTTPLSPHFSPSSPSSLFLSLPLSLSLSPSFQHADDWTNVLAGVSVLMEKRSEECDLDVHRFNECHYYLRNYGHVSMLVSFYARHNCWADACKYILDHVSAKGGG